MDIGNTLKQYNFKISKDEEYKNTFFNKLTFQKRLALLCIEAARNTYCIRESNTLLNLIEQHILTGLGYNYNTRLINSELLTLLTTIRLPLTIATTVYILDSLLAFSYKEEPVKGYSLKELQYIWQEKRMEAKAYQNKLVFDIFPPYCGKLALIENSTVKAIINGIKKTNDFSAIPMLGDALEDAGCTDKLILNHCRQAKFHCKYCWVLQELG